MNRPFLIFVLAASLAFVACKKALVEQNVSMAGEKLDMVAAALDVTTNTFEHTGIQTVARRIVSRAYGEI